jgi:hypothetical protein
LCFQIIENPLFIGPCTLALWRHPSAGHYDKDRPAIIACVSRQGGVVIQATRDFTVKTVQKAADLAVYTGSRLYTDSASSYWTGHGCSKRPHEHEDAYGGQYGQWS